MNVAMNLMYKMREFLNNRRTVGLSRRTLLHGVVCIEITVCCDVVSCNQVDCYGRLVDYSASVVRAGPLNLRLYIRQLHGCQDDRSVVIHRPFHYAVRPFD